jgi:hypothetical protein
LELFPAIRHSCSIALRKLFAAIGARNFSMQKFHPCDIPEKFFLGKNLSGVFY